MEMRLFMAVRIAVPATMTPMQPMMMVAVPKPRALAIVMATQPAITVIVMEM